MHIGTGNNPSQTECILFTPPGLSNNRNPPPTDPPTSLTPPWPSRQNKAINRDAHVRTNNTPSSKKQRSSNWKEDSSPSPITSSTCVVIYHTLSNTLSSGTQPKTSSTLACNSTYFPQVFQSTTPWKFLLRIVNIPELMKLILEEVVSKDADAAEDTEEKAEEK